MGRKEFELGGWTEEIWYFPEPSGSGFHKKFVMWLRWPDFPELYIVKQKVPKCIPEDTNFHFHWADTAQHASEHFNLLTKLRKKHSLLFSRHLKNWDP